jgi:hypothetical protein
MMRAKLATVFVAVLASLGLQAGPADAAPRTCAGDLRAKCLIRPRLLATGAHTYVRGIHWRTWTPRTALGFGTLVELGGATYPGFKSRAKIRLRVPAECNGRDWFWSMTIKFGRHLGRPYLRADEYTPC